MKEYALPLVTFTSLSQTAVGMAVFLVWRSLKRTDEPGNRKAWFVTGLIMGAALIGAMFHLSHPLRAYDAFDNLSDAWLSREILAACAFSFGILATFLTGGNRALGALTALLGMCLVAVQGLTYAPPAMPAIYNAFPMALYALTAWVMGAAAAPMMHEETTPGPLKGGLWAFLVLILVVPCVWSSGGTIMRMTSDAWGGSGLYWGGVVCCSAALAMASRRGCQAAVTAVVLFVGIVLNRLTFFGDTVSTIVNIGRPY